MSPELLLGLGVGAVVLGGLGVALAALAGWSARAKVAAKAEALWEDQVADLEDELDLRKQAWSRTTAGQKKHARYLHRRADALRARRGDRRRMLYAERPAPPRRGPPDPPRRGDPPGPDGGAPPAGEGLDPPA